METLIYNIDSNDRNKHHFQILYEFTHNNIDVTYNQIVDVFDGDGIKLNHY